jgi:2-(1,2-epoxy-1,2-dihydrophenyl)acetyl-CoA isomerase
VSQRVSLQIDARGIARLRLAWPERRNAIDLEMVEALRDAVERCADPQVRVVLISAEGETFTVGGDLRHLGTQGDLHAALAQVVPTFNGTLARLGTLDALVVAAVQGAIAGGGLGLAWCADIVLAARGTRFATGFAEIGLSGDGGSSWWLPRLVGLRRAQQMLIGGRVLEAQEALEWGLVTEVLDPAELNERAEVLVRQLADGPAPALQTMRRTLRESQRLTLAEGLEAETVAMVASGASADGREGVEAFLQKRPAKFNSRDGGMGS